MGSFADALHYICLPFAMKAAGKPSEMRTCYGGDAFLRVNTNRLPFLATNSSSSGTTILVRLHKS